MKVIFLDIDGVLRRISDQEITDIIFHPETVKNMNDLVSKTNAQVVITSDWRLRLSINQLQEFFNDSGLTFKIYDITNNLANESTRPTYEQIRVAEINKYLREHPGISEWCVIDDLELDIDNFIHTDFSIGLSVSDVNKAEKILNSQTEMNKSYIKLILENEITPFNLKISIEWIDETDSGYSESHFIENKSFNDLKDLIDFMKSSGPLKTVTKKFRIDYPDIFYKTENINGKVMIFEPFGMSIYDKNKIFDEIIK